MKKRILLLGLGLVIVLVVGVVVFLGSIIKAGVEKVGPRVAKVSVKLDGARISAFNGSGELKGFVLGNPPGYTTTEAIKVGTISVSVVPMSVLKDKVIVRSIRVDAPEITYETDLKGSNLGKILDNVKGSATQDEKAPTESEQTTKTKLQVDDFLITKAKVRVAAGMLGSGVVEIPDIHLTNLGQGPDGITPAELSNKVLSAVLDATTKAIAANPGRFTKGAEDAAKAIGTGAADQLKKGVGDLLKKK